MGGGYGLYTTEAQDRLGSRLRGHRAVSKAVVSYSYAPVPCRERASCSRQFDNFGTRNAAALAHRPSRCEGSQSSKEIPPVTFPPVAASHLFVPAFIIVSPNLITPHMAPVGQTTGYQPGHPC